MMMKTLLDENIAPSLFLPLWEMGIDTATVRDRGLLGADDHIVWRLAQSEGRTTVTINAGDFRRLARQTPGHAGLIIIPSGSGRAGQLRMIESVVAKAREENAILPTFRSRIYEVLQDGSITIEISEEPSSRTTTLRVVN